jgi:hypothetical protein
MTFSRRSIARCVANLFRDIRLMIIIFFDLELDLYDGR